MRQRPFRAPHHSLSRAGLIGGGTPPRPGEVSLTHRGVLFLDELSEFARTLLDSLREPLENGSVWIARASGTSCYPAQALLVAAMNPWACVFNWGIRRRYWRASRGTWLAGADGGTQ